MGRVLLIDGGRSHCRVALSDGGAPFGHRITPALPPGGDLAAITAAVVEAAGAVGGGSPIEAASMGLAGVLGTGAGDEVATRLARIFGVRTLLTSDAVIAHAGALGGRPGVVTVAGTGAVAIGADSDGTARSDGWGHLVGDAGSGYWIGRRGIEAALRFKDDRGGSSLLARLAEAHLGPLVSLPARLHAAPDGVAMVAAFAEHVAVAAYTGGDSLARSIWTDAAGELATTTAACANRLFPAADVVAVSWAGGLFDAPEDLLLRPFLDRLSELLPHAAPVPPAGDPLTGAALMAGPDGPGLLAPLVHTAPEPARNQGLIAR